MRERIIALAALVLTNRGSRLALDGDGGTNMRMRLVVEDLEVIKLVIEDAVRVPPDRKAWQR